MIDLPTLARAILQTSSDAMIATDREGIVRYWNPGATRIFGFDPAEMVGRSLDPIIPESQRQRHWQGYRRTMATGESRYGHGDILAVPALTKAGARISIEFTITMLSDQEGRPRGALAILRDVTKRFEEMRTLRRCVTAEGAAGHDPHVTAPEAGAMARG